MKAIFLLFVSSLILLAQEEPKALPEVPQIKVDAQKSTQNASGISTESQNTQNPPTKPQAENTSLPQTQDTQNSQNSPIVQQTPQDSNASNPLENPENNATSKGRNPFVPLVTPKGSGQVSSPPTLQLFTKSEFQLPSTARKLQKITIEYQNLNGSTSILEKEVEGDIDWHFPLILTQGIQQEEKEAPSHKPFSLGNQFHFNTQDASITLKTPFKMIRNFTLASPTRLVLDFENPSREPLNADYDTQLPVFTQFLAQSHLDFYRITIVLDGQYNYTIQENKQNKSYQIDFN
ncbi:MAG: AMIN domain-containing protein [Helicobacter sp.]|nr:AMIN domain-containing protein [Helicobacter sp.]